MNWSHWRFTPGSGAGSMRNFWQPQPFEVQVQTFWPLATWLLSMSMTLPECLATSVYSPLPTRSSRHFWQSLPLPGHWMTRVPSAVPHPVTSSTWSECRARSM
nr:hypothetical protein [Saccharothrix variisporea]